MTRSRIAVGLVLVAIALWWGGRKVLGGSGDDAPVTQSRPGRTISPELRDSLAKARARAHVDVHPRAADGEVTLAGRVIDVLTQTPVGNVEVVFRSAEGETTTTTVADGSYTIRVPTGMYRAFVRDDSVLSVGRPDLVRVPGAPRADTAGVPDEALMAVVIASADTGDVDLTVVRGGTLTGHVLDRNGKAIAGAVLRARGGTLRPTLGTDIAESDADGSFELRLPEGAYELDATHPRYAGVSSDAHVAIDAGGRTVQDVTLTPGCIISGRVVAEDGHPAGEGAVEKKWGETEFEFAPSGRIEPDGTFQWVTTDETTVTIRAWPWKSPPSASRAFACKDGARFPDVVFQIPHRAPDLEGTLVDHSGRPVAFAFVDVQPQSAGGVGQQERTDAEGRWAVFNLPSGPYRIVAQAEGRGVTSAHVTSPRSQIALALGGTGKLVGKAARLPSGSFQLLLGTCVEADGIISLPPQRRVVTVTGGKFEVDDLPACTLSFGGLWQGHVTAMNVTIPADGVATAVLDIGPRPTKTVRGTITDDAGKPVASAIINAVADGEPVAHATSDAAGHYTIRATAGARLEANSASGFGASDVADDEADQTIDIAIHANEFHGRDLDDHDEPDVEPDEPVQ